MSRRVYHFLPSSVTSFSLLDPVPVACGNLRMAAFTTKIVNVTCERCLKKVWEKKNGPRAPKKKTP